LIAQTCLVACNSQAPTDNKDIETEMFASPIETPENTVLPVTAQPIVPDGSLNNDKESIADRVDTEPVDEAAPSSEFPKKTNALEFEMQEKSTLHGWCIGIDPGHQARSNHEKEPNGPDSLEMKNKVSSGTSGRFTGVPEHEVTLDIALRLRDMLEESGATVITTRTTADVDISNKERALMLNSADVDFIIRIHCDGNDDPSIHGSSMLVPDGEYVERIEEESYVLGETIHKEFLQLTERKDRGVHKRSDQTGFNWSTVPVCTIEMAFMTNESEDNLLNNEEFRDKCAVGLFEGIMAYAKLKMR